jgi:DNA polymerase (family 10)
VDSTEIAATLAELGRLLEATGAPGYRVRAYERAAHAIAQLPESEVERLVEKGRLEDVPHVGAGLSKKIEALVRTGTWPELEALRGRMPKGYRQLVRVDGLGPKKVLALHDALGIGDLDDLERAVHDQRIRTVKGFSAATESRLLDAIQAARERQDRHLWLVAMREAERLLPRLSGAGATSVTLGDGARRAHEEVDVLSLVVQAADAAVIAHALEGRGALLGAVRAAPDRITGTSPDGMPVEIVIASPGVHAAALVWATGPDEHVHALVERAAQAGLELSPDGVFDGESLVPLADERALYARLGVPWVPPELRDDPSALGADHSGLVRVEDIVGMVHCHTTYSDGRNTVEEMAQACDRLGIAYLTITDHSPTASYAGGVEREQLAAQWADIDRVQRTVKVQILKGTESDILADGALDYPDEVLTRMDVVIASIHQRYKLDREGMTERLVAMMRHPLFKIWGHGLGRLIGRRDPVDCDVERVLDAAAENRVAIEINADPHRLDLQPRWVRAARERGLPIVVSVDAHSVGGLSVLPFGIGIARRAGVTKDEVLNTRDAGEFRAAVRPAGAPSGS